jgi:hypothetical protein
MSHKDELNLAMLQVAACMTSRGPATALYAAGGTTLVIDGCDDALQGYLDVLACLVPGGRQLRMLVTLNKRWRAIHGVDCKTVASCLIATRSCPQTTREVSEVFDSSDAMLRKHAQQDADLDLEWGSVMSRKPLRYWLAGVYPTGLVCLRASDSDAALRKCSTMFPHSEDVMVEETTADEFSRLFSLFNSLSR